MKSRVVRIIVVLLVFNLSLVAITALLSLQATVQHPMQGTLVDSGEHQLHVIDSALAQGHENPQSAKLPASNSNTFVLIHGASTSALDFSTNLQPILAQHGRVIAIDRPGHGYSDRGTPEAATEPAHQALMILDTLETLGIHDPILIGHSWAGAVVLAALLSEHEKVQIKAGILIAGVSHPWDGDNPLHVELSVHPVFGDIFLWQYISPLGRLSMQSAVESVFTPERVPDNYIENTGLILSLRPDTHKHNAQDRIGLSRLLETQSLRYQEVSQPLLSIAASEDSVVPAWNHHDQLVEQIPHMQGLMMTGAGHAPHHTRTQEVADAILSFTQSLDSSTN